MKHSIFVTASFIFLITFLSPIARTEETPQDPIQKLRSDIRELGHKTYTLWELLDGYAEVVKRTMEDIDEQGPNFNEDYIAGEWAGAEYFLSKAYRISGALTYEVKWILEQGQAVPDAEAHEAAVWLLDELKLVIKMQGSCEEKVMQLNKSVEAVFGAATNPNIQAHPAIFFGSADVGCGQPLVDEAIDPAEELVTKTKP